jgi:hypothetical protein
MSGFTTLLSDRVESLLPHSTAAACITPETYCSSYCDDIKGSCLWLYRYCRLSCHGKFEGCGDWYDGRCS